MLRAAGRGRRCRTGEVATDLLRPVNVVLLHLATDLGRAGHAMLFRFGPPMLVGALVFDLYLPARPGTWPLFVVSVLLAVVICFACRYLVNTAAYWLLDLRGVATAWAVGSGLACGLYFPLRFLPDWLAAAFYLGTQAVISRADAQPGAVVPDLVVAATARAAALGFAASCEEPVGQLLAALAAAVPPGGRILELGTGAGVGTAWLVGGLGDRCDVCVTTVEEDAGLAATVRAAGWPQWVDVVTADAKAVLPQLAGNTGFGLIFADAVAGKWTGLELTLEALAPGGVLVVDDMDLSRYPDPAHRAAVTRVQQTLATDPRLVTVRLDTGTGLTLATRQRG